jgi:hypothetical protein
MGPVHHQHGLARLYARRTAFTQVFTGSTKAASSASTPSGTGIAPRSTIQSSAFTYSLKPPPAPRSWPWCRCACTHRTARRHLPAVEAAQAGDVMVEGDAVAFAEARDAGPARPPRPRSRARDAGPGRSPFCTFLMSVPQTPQASTRTTISPGPGSGAHLLRARRPGPVDGGFHRRHRLGAGGAKARQAPVRRRDPLAARITAAAVLTATRQKRLRSKRTRSPCARAAAGRSREPVRAVGHRRCTR